MLSEIIVKYNKAKFEIVNKFSDNDINVCEESLCIDTGYLKSKFEDFQNQYKSICREIENLYEYGDKDDYNKLKINALVDAKDRLCLNTAYLVSNDIKNIDLSKELIKDINTDFSLALDGISGYFLGDINKADKYLEKYYSTLNILPNHYLINKVYSLILLNKKEYNLAIEIMRRAVSINPNDLELHVNLRDTYLITSDSIGYKVESKIIKLLEG